MRANHGGSLHKQFIQALVKSAFFFSLIGEKTAWFHISGKGDIKSDR